MPKFYEVFGINASKLQEVGLLNVKTAICPFTETACDGGGNRHQTKITITPEHEFTSIFDATLKSIVPAVCSIDYGTDQWVVCPRRLMGFKNDRPIIPPVNLSLQDHEKQVLVEAGLKTGIEYGVWPEVYLQYVIEDVEIDYHFDFVIAPLVRDINFYDLVQNYDAEESEISNLAKCAKTGGYLRGKLGKDSVIHAAPNLDQPIIIEVMTASTSGSNTAAGTNIASAFRNLILGNDYQGPGINKR